MKTFYKIAAQGELRFVRLPDDYKMPANAEKISPENGLVIVGHSETGHHHVMLAERTTLYKLPDSILDCLLIVEKSDELKHLREFDTHESISFVPGKYLVRTAREHTPEGWRKSQD